MGWHVRGKGASVGPPRSPGEVVCWVVLYTHRHGADVWPIFRCARPTEASIIKGLPDWEPDKGEVIDIVGPFRLPGPSAQELGDAYSKGWDTHEGSLLRILGIRDLECIGIDAIMKDLVQWPGFREWRKRFKKGSLEQQEARLRALRRKT